jgi:hypothetical protein
MHRRRGLSASRPTSLDQERRALFGDAIRALFPRAAEALTNASPTFDMTYAKDRFFPSDRSSCGGLCSQLAARLPLRGRRSPAAQVDAKTLRNKLRNNMIASSGQIAECG